MDKAAEITLVARIHSLKQAGDASAVGELRDLLDHPSGAVSMSALPALETIGGPAAAEALRAALHHEDGRMRAVAVCALAKVAGPESVDDLVAVPGDENHSVWWQTARRQVHRRRGREDLRPRGLLASEAPRSGRARPSRQAVTDLFRSSCCAARGRPSTP